MSKGVWTLASESNPKWTAMGTSDMPVGMGIPTECHEAVKKMAETFEEDVPADLKVSYMRGAE